MRLKLNKSVGMLMAVVLAFCGASQAKWAMITESVPTERLIKNIAEYVHKNPTDAHG